MFRRSKYRVVWRYLWSNGVTNCDIRIWDTLGEVKLFVFLFVIKPFLNLLLQYRCVILFC